MAKSNASKAALTPDQIKAGDAFAVAYQAARAAEAQHAGPCHASEIRAFLACRATGLSRDTIAVRFLGKTSGALSRHVVVASKADSPVTVGETAYRSALAALDAGAASLSNLYDIFRPTRKNGSKGRTFKSIQDAALSLVQTAVKNSDPRPKAVKFKNGRKTEVFSPAASRADWTAFLGIILSLPVGGLTADTVESILTNVPAAPEAVPVAPLLTVVNG